jgi:hypothetical protein
LLKGFFREMLKSVCLISMGIIRCSKHGISGISAVCPHIRENVSKGVKTTFCCELETQFDDGMPLLSWLICQICLKEFRLLGLPENNILQGMVLFWKLGKPFSKKEVLCNL